MYYVNTSFIYLFVCFLSAISLIGCSDTEDKSSSDLSSSSGVDKEVIYGWAKKSSVVRVSTATSFKSDEFQDHVLITGPSKTKSNQYQYALRGVMDKSGEVHSLQLYTISVFNNVSISKKDSWVELNRGEMNETKLNTNLVTEQIECSNSCSIYQHVTVDFEDLDVLKEIANQDGFYEFKLVGEFESKSFKITMDYFKGFVLALQEFIDYRTEYESGGLTTVEMKNLFLKHSN